ncbi:MAG: arsenite methyltransferase [Dehalococcoidia bacterium]
MTDTTDIHGSVRDHYGARARSVSTENADSRSVGSRATLYADPTAAALPDSVVSYGCGNPIAIAGLQPGEVVLDLGSGAGLDCFLAGQQVGPTGHVIGLDMTEDMLALAEANRAKVGATNVEFRKGLIESIPYGDAAVDVVISNCVINLSPDKDAVFHEAFRILRPGGRFQVSDVVLTRDITEAERADLDLWAGCKSGALLNADYEARLRAAGFEDVEIILATPEPGTDPAEADAPWQSALINARRPGGTEAGTTWRLPSGERIELLAPIGLETAACCDDTCCE